MKDIEELWLIQKSGIPMFKYPKEPEGTGDSLFAGMLTAILALVKESTGEIISNIVMMNHTFFINPIEKLRIIIAVKTPMNTKTKEIQKQLEALRDKLLEMYSPSDIDRWDGNCDTFKTFEEHLIKEKNKFQQYLSGW